MKEWETGAIQKQNLENVFNSLALKEQNHVRQPNRNV